jgi:hypothetical protein
VERGVAGDVSAPGVLGDEPRHVRHAPQPDDAILARSTGGSPSSSLQVSVVFKSALGLINSLPVGSVQASDSWEPTPQYVLLINALPGDYHVVAFRFTPRGDATWGIDAAYVDPWSKG